MEVDLSFLNQLPIKIPHKYFKQEAMKFVMNYLRFGDEKNPLIEELRNVIKIGNIKL